MLIVIDLSTVYRTDRIGLLDVEEHQVFAERTDAVVRCPAFLGDPKSATMRWTYGNASPLPTCNNKFTPGDQMLTIRDIRTEDTVLNFKCSVIRDSDLKVFSKLITVEVVPQSEYTFLRRGRVSIANFHIFRDNTVGEVKGHSYA